MDFPKLRSLQQLRLLVWKLAAESEAIVGAKANGWRLKPMRSQWGSCNAQGIIALNSRLMYLPERLVAYIIHHEVLHLKIKSHGVMFQRHMKTNFPDWSLLNKQLRHFSPVIRN